ncbi:hypothetical protein [Alienimonas chondri]|uniref:PepSY domain-containing protein n=1 Tax=Alienimonas chondri TaxID=2681879 RepID=A0ABX1VBE9_9PLAN|nr:hypothetical protein [Alienimonas chondri]NNJ25435.1 hypothetical protein [Alienimonas chondri]
MFALFRSLNRAGGVLWTLLLPATVLLAALGAAFVIAPPVSFREDAGERMQSVVPRVDRESDQLRISASLDAADTTFPQFLEVSLMRRVRPSPVNTVLTEWEPAPGVRYVARLLQGRQIRMLKINVGWIVGWALGLSLLWWGWAASTGRFARSLDDRSLNDGSLDHGGQRTGRWTALRRAARPWLAGFALVGGLCLLAPYGSGWEDHSLKAEVRRDPHTPLHPRVLWVAWERDNPSAPPQGTPLFWAHGSAPAEPLWFAREWGLRVEKARIAPPMGCSDRDASRGGRPRIAAAISLWWLAAPLALWSAGSLWNSRSTFSAPKG